MLRRSQRIASLGLSEIVQISEAAAVMRAEGHDILALSTGEPDFPTPETVCRAAITAMGKGQTRYTPTAGTPALRNAVAKHAGFSAEASEVIISTGAKQVLANLFLATLDVGDEVIIPTPYWTSYRDIVAMADGTTVEISCDGSEGFKLSPEKLEAAITPKTRWVLLNSPSNPSGAMYTYDELVALGEVLKVHPHVWVASDEIYQHIAYAPFTSFRNAVPELADRTLIINGVSKAYSMTGWRIGWGIGPVELIKAMVAVQGQSTSGACSIAQAASVEALEGDQSFLEGRKDNFMARRDYMVEHLNATDMLSCPLPDGAFYVFPSCEGTFGAKTPEGEVIETDADFCRYLLKSVGVAVVPGRAFSMPGHFRVSYAYAQSELEEGCLRIQQAVAKLTKL